MTPGEGPPAILLGGVNSLSVARRLGRRGVRVLWAGDDDLRLSFSRYCRRLRLPAGPGPWYERAGDFLLGPGAEHLEGAVLLACNDRAVELIARRKDELSRRFLVDATAPEVQLCMLDKLCTYRAAAAAGVPTPRFWTIGSSEELAAIRHELVFPLIVKPLDSSAFQAAFDGAKHLTAHDRSEVEAAVERFGAARLEFMLVERIPGPDSLLCSYYTYMEDDGTPAGDFTKRIVRRQPLGEGQATLHVTGWIPEVRESALRLLQHSGHRGLAAVEFKRDERDGVLKLIEANVRFTGCNAIVASSGVDLAYYVYSRLTGGDYRLPARFREGRRLWNPRRDLQAVLDLRASGEISLPAWLRSLRPAEMFYAVPYDPLPGLGGVVESARRLVRRTRHRR